MKVTSEELLFVFIIFVVILLLNYVVLLSARRIGTCCWQGCILLRRRKVLWRWSIVNLVLLYSKEAASTSFIVILFNLINVILVDNILLRPFIQLRCLGLSLVI